MTHKWTDRCRDARPRRHAGEPPTQYILRPLHMNQADPPSSQPQGIVIPGSHRLVTRLSWLYASLALLVLLLLSAVLLPAGVLPNVHALATELLAGGLAALGLSALLLALTGVLATLLLTRA